MECGIRQLTTNCKIRKSWSTEKRNRSVTTLRNNEEGRNPINGSAKQKKVLTIKSRRERTHKENKHEHISVPLIGGSADWPVDSTNNRQHGPPFCLLTQTPITSEPTICSTNDAHR